MGWRNSNNSLFAGNNVLDDDFVDERLGLDSHNEGSHISNIDLYRGEVVEKTIGVLSEKKSCEESSFKKIEINGIEVEYKIIVEKLLTFSESTKQASDIGARLPSEEEFDSILDIIGSKEFTKSFPGVKYTDREKTVGEIGKMAYFWINEEGNGLNKKVKIFVKGNNDIINSEIGKQFSVCMIVIK